MSGLVDRITGDMNSLQKIVSKIPGFGGYTDRVNRRTADKLLRETIANHFEGLWQRLSAVQKEMINEGGVAYLARIESASIKLRQFIDRVKTASYGYAGFFDAVKVNKEELDRLYQFDAALVSLEDEVSRAIDNVEASVGTDGLPAAIRNLTKVAQSCLNTFNQRQETIIGTGSGSEAAPAP